MRKEFHFTKPKPTTKAILTAPNNLYQDKSDGISIEGIIEDDYDTVLWGRGVLKGKDSNFTDQFPELVEAIKNSNIPHNSKFLAEAVIINSITGKQDSGLVSGRSHRTNNFEYYANKQSSQLIINDIIQVDNINVTNRNYLSRIRELKKYLPHIYNIANDTRISNDGRAISPNIKLKDIPQIYILPSYTDGVELWKQIVLHGKEGIIIRNPFAPLGEKIWKLKQEISEDVFCKGEFNASTSKTNSNLSYKVDGRTRTGVFANLVCYQLTKEGKEIQVCNVGGGFKRQDRIEIQQLLDMGTITKDTPLVIELTAFDRNLSLKLKSPHFERIRHDKNWKNCIIHEKNTPITKIKQKDEQKSIGDY